MKKIIVPFLFVLVTSVAFSQSYCPISPGNVWHYKTPDSFFEDSIRNDKFTYKGVSYFQNIRTEPNVPTQTFYYRVTGDGALHYLDARTFSESIEVPANPKKSFTWDSTDGNWRYEIVDLDATLKIPGKVFSNCLVIKAIQLAPGADRTIEYLNYYVKGVGLVGNKINNKLVAYLDHWNVKGTKNF